LLINSITIIIAYINDHVRLFTTNNNGQREYALRERLKGNVRVLKTFSYWPFEKSHYE